VARTDDVVPDNKELVEAVPWSATRSSVIASGARRLEAEAYLTDGYGIRLTIESRPSGWKPLGELADVWQPSRLKGILVSPSSGVPFLSAGQVFEAVPTPRKWLSLSKTKGAADCYVTSGTILVSRSGNVGRVTVAHEPHVDVVLSDDLLRVSPHEDFLRGWLYAYMRTSSFRMMATTLRYGHVIKHLEVHHLSALPVIEVDRAVAERMTSATDEIFTDRDKAQALVRRAESIYFEDLEEYKPTSDYDTPFVVSSGTFDADRRRLDGFYHNRVATDILGAIKHYGRSTDKLLDVCARIFYPKRFRRFFGDNGTPYRSAEELFDLNAPVTKRVYASLVEDAEEYMLHAGWLVMACSGQVYGLNGAVMLLDHRHEGIFGTHDLIRLVPDGEKIRTGYLLLALGNRLLGRPVVVRNAYGTSIPHLDVMDVEQICIPRLDDAVEAEISELMVKAVKLGSRADDLEDAITAEAEGIVSKFIRGLAD
jgi:type I restriction enzyme, S subunit